MSKAFWVTVRTRVTFCDQDECPYAGAVRVGQHYSTIECRALGKHIRWSCTEDFPVRCPRGNKRNNQSIDRR